MKKLLCVTLALLSCFAFSSCKEEGKKVTSTPSTQITVSYLDINGSVFVSEFNENEFQQRVFMECDIVSGDITKKYTAAKSGDCMYVKYTTADETKIYIYDGFKTYLLNEADKTATVETAIPTSYGNLLFAFDKEQLNRFFETGKEKIGDTEYTFETFVTDGGFCKYYLDNDNNVKYMHNWNTGTSDNAIFKVTFNELHNEPLDSYFTLPEDYTVVTAN